MKFLLSLLTLCTLMHAADSQLFLTGGSGDDEFQCIHRLSDGSFLVGGGSTQLDWLPKNTPSIELSGITQKTGDTGRIAFLAHIAPDLSSLRTIIRLPKGFATSIRHIHTTEIPGSTTGAIHISGAVTAGGDSPKAGYFIARLDENFLTTPPKKLAWCYIANAKGALTEIQPWDVSADGRVIFAQGESYSHDWLSIDALDHQGRPCVIENWPRHWSATGEHEGTASTSPSPATYSCIVLKTQGRGDFRSQNKEDFERESDDGNGGIKKGKWPFDAMFDGYFDPASRKTVAVTTTGKGYYGYRWGGNACAHVSAISIDRRNGAIFLGGNNKSKLPDGLPDFEPWVVAMADSGKLFWWQRLYAESKGVSTPDQYVDAIAVDYSVSEKNGGSLTILARAHGNNVNNFWTSTEIKHRSAPGKAWQDHFTGTNGNIHYQWLGRMTIDTGSMTQSSYFAEYSQNAKFDASKKIQSKTVDAWPDIKAGWPDFNTTKARTFLAIATDGAVGIAATGRNIITTRDAHQSFPTPSDPQRGPGTWADFVRVFQPDLTDLRYSSLVTGAWDKPSGKGGDNLTVNHLCHAPGGICFVGTLKSEGELPPIQGTPAWASAKRIGGTDAVIGFFPVK